MTKLGGLASRTRAALSAFRRACATTVATGGVAQLLIGRGARGLSVDSRGGASMCL